MTDYPLIAFLQARYGEAEERAKRIESYGGCCSGCHCGCIDAAEALADIAAKRRVLDWFERCGPQARGHSGLRAAVRILAEPYADHADYREEWRL